MTTDFIANDEITSTADFEDALGQIIIAALQNDVDPRGAWEYRINEPESAVEVMIVELSE
jgi:hypothetical protein